MSNAISGIAKVATLGLGTGQMLPPSVADKSGVGGPIDDALKPPTPPVTPPPLAMPVNDDLAALAEKKRKMASANSSAGWASTVLSQSGNDTLG